MPTCLPPTLTLILILRAPQGAGGIALLLARPGRGDQGEGKVGQVVQ